MSEVAPSPEPDTAASWIPAYRVILFNTHGLGSLALEVDAASDDEALKMARILAKGRAFELWDALVMLGRYDPMR